MFKTLIVEDSTFYRQLLKETLIGQFPSIEISEAESGEEALEMIKASLPDLIFMDIKLPGDSGLEVTKKIKIQYPDIPVIIITSYDLPEYREAAKKYQANHFLSKGTTTKENILTLVKSILTKRNIDLNGHDPREPY
jgi:CheY-like chemotaxis protein